MTKRIQHTHQCNSDLKGFEAVTDFTGTTVTVKIPTTITNEGVARAAAVLATIAAQQAREDFLFIEDLCS